MKITNYKTSAPVPDTIRVNFLQYDWYVERIVNIIRNLFPNVTIRDPLFTYFQGYTTQEKITFPKCDLMRNMNTNNILNGDYDLCIDALSSIPDFKEIETDEKFLERAKSIGPEDRQYTGKKNDKMLISNRKNKNVIKRRRKKRIAHRRINRKRKILNT